MRKVVGVAHFLHILGWLREYVEPHKNDKKPVIALYNSSHGVYRSGIVRDMIETVHGIDDWESCYIGEW